MPGEPVLEVEDLKTIFLTRHGVIKAVNGVSFAVEAGKTLGLVGESGCGKTVTSLSLLGLIEPPGKILSGEVRLNGYDLLSLSQKQLRRVRGKEISIVFQNPMTSLNPVLTVGTQIIETIISHEGVSRAEARQRALDLLARVGLPYSEKLLKRYPFQLSGGMRQRVMIAIALALRPKVLIADEPTTALDVTVQAQILTELRRLQAEFDTAIILITHDLGVVAEMADEVAVMYAGSIVEYGGVIEVFESPGHPYTRALLRSVPRLDRKCETLEHIQGQPPSLLNLPDRCAFLPRCPVAVDACDGPRPQLEAVASDHLVACYQAHRIRAKELQPA
ncbi:MAG: peptide/nickel transport system ATP-binding protein [Thermacetogenium sp.]|nr:peptide/nickel transport system ATP-binding protein [Thermacetogenium sp.]